MYIIKKLDTTAFKFKRYGKKVFVTYEEARSYVRKIIRKADKDYTMYTRCHNPPMDFYGFQVCKVK